MHRHCGTNNRAPRWTFTDPCKPEVRPGAREESASPAWLAAPAMNAHDTTKVYIWRLDTGCGPTLYRKCHSHNTPGQVSTTSNEYLDSKLERNNYVFSCCMGIFYMQHNMIFFPSNFFYITRNIHSFHQLITLNGFFFLLNLLTCLIHFFLSFKISYSRFRFRN